MSQAEQAHEREQAWLAVTLAWVAGFVDAVGYLTLFELFIAHMSGNSVRTGIFAGQGQWHDALDRLIAIPLFVLGVGLGTALLETAVRRGVRSSVSVVLSLEVGLLLSFAVGGSILQRDGELSADVGWRYYLLVALAVMAMGMQNATLRRVGALTVRTTFVTGMLTTLAEEGVKYLFGQYDRVRGRRERAGAAPRTSLDRALLLSGIWGGYIVGAVCGAFGHGHWLLGALALPVAVLAGIAVLDRVRPISVPEGSSTGAER